MHEMCECLFGNKKLIMFTWIYFDSMLCFQVVAVFTHHEGCVYMCTYMYVLCLLKAVYTLSLITACREVFGKQDKSYKLTVL